MAKFRNLLGKPATLNGHILPSKGKVVVGKAERVHGKVSGVSVEGSINTAEGLPEPVRGIFLVVPSDVAFAQRLHRSDLCYPINPVLRSGVIQATRIAYAGDPGQFQEWNNKD